MSKVEECVSVKKIGKLTKVYIYSIGYNTCEESDYVYLTHEQQFTSEQIRELVEEAVVTVISEMKRKDDYNVSSYQDVHSEVIDVFVNTKGFHHLQLQVDWSCFGWSSLFKHDNWGYECDNNKKLVEAVLKAGFTEADDSFLQECRSGMSNENE